MLEQIFSGAGIGLLLGILLGLSASPVVGLVVGAVAALIASFVNVRMPGKDDSGLPTAAERKLAAIRAGVFGFTCVAGILGGLYMRTHDSLSPTLQQRIAELRGVGFSEAEARQLAVVVRTPEPGRQGAGGPDWTKSVLFREGTERCERLNPERYQDIDAAIGAYRSMDEGALASVARTVKSSVPDERVRMDLLHSIVEALCARH